MYVYMYVLYVIVITCVCQCDLIKKLDDDDDDDEVLLTVNDKYAYTRVVVKNTSNWQKPQLKTHSESLRRKKYVVFLKSANLTGQ